jgi:hypothetical protein
VALHDFLHCCSYVTQTNINASLLDACSSSGNAVATAAAAAMAAAAQ